MKKKNVCWGCGASIHSSKVNYCSICFDELRRLRKECKQKGIGNL